MTKLVFFALSCLLVGCNSGEIVEETIERTYHVQPNASISIENKDGSILVYGSNSAEIVVQATKHAYSQNRLNQIDVVVSAQPDSVRIETKFPPHPQWSFSDRSGTVDYVLVIPQTATITRLEMATGEVLIENMRGGPVRAQIGDGLLNIRNCFCDLGLAIHRGALSASFDWWEPRKFLVDARIENGKALFAFPGHASFHLMAEAERDNIDNDFAEPEERTGSRVSKLYKVIGKAPNAEIKIHVAEGDIQISEQDP